MTLSFINDINIIGGNMTDEEVKAYVFKIEKVSLDEVESVLPSLDSYNADVAINKICDTLAENINILRKLSSETEKNNLSSEILTLLKKYYICVHYLDVHNELIHNQNDNGFKVIFAKTPTGKAYFKIDLDKVPIEIYGEVKNTLDNMLNGLNMSDTTKVKYYIGADFPQKVLEFKGFQVRIFTIKLKEKVLCIVGLEIKKSNRDKKIDTNLKNRLVTIKKQIEKLRMDMNDPVKKNELLLDGQKILDDIINALQRDTVVEDVEYLFPSDEELEAMVPYVDIEAENSDVLDESLKETLIENDISDSSVINDVVSQEVPKAAKKVKRRSRGLGKKTIARNNIANSLKGLTLEELAKIQDFITRLKMDKSLNDTIGNIYEGFLNMSDDEIGRFEEGIKDFKHDDIGRSK